MSESQLSSGQAQALVANDKKGTIEIGIRWNGDIDTKLDDQGTHQISAQLSKEKFVDLMAQAGIKAEVEEDTE